MAHECPDCGQVCYCNGDIDDVEMEVGADGCICYLQCQEESDEDIGEVEDDHDDYDDDDA